MQEDEATGQYRGEAGRAYHEEKRDIPAVALPWMVEMRASKFDRYVLPHHRVFEFGAGRGWNLAGLKCGARLGHDISEWVEAGLSDLGIEFCSDIADVPKESHDVVICHHSLEHTLEPARVLRRLRDILVPGGKLLVFVPYENERRQRRFESGEANHHLYSWNPQTLGNLLTVLGFEVTEAGLGPFLRDRFSARLAVRLGLGRPGFRVLRSVAHRLLPLFETRLVAEKPAQGDQAKG